MQARVLIVDDDADVREAVGGSLVDLGYQVELCPDALVAAQVMEQKDFDAVVSDVRMPSRDGVELCASIAGNRPDVPVVLMTAFGDTEVVARAIRAGATDFLPKPFTLDQLDAAMRRAVERRRKSERVERLPEDEEELGEPIAGIVGSSHAMRMVARSIRQGARSDCTVLVTGETGTGKELVARALHEHSARRAGPFVALSCAALPQETIESELFGHVPGAFTGAVRSQAGLFRAANGGTLFLDEIGTMLPPLQVRLLRAMEDRSVRPLGSVTESRVDVRLVATTNHDLRAAASAGDFREDLLFRLSAFEISLPPLRERGSDVVELAQHFLQRHASDGAYQLTSDALAELQAYSWPGNVRELENVVHAAVAAAPQRVIDTSMLPARVRGGGIGLRADSPTDDLGVAERRHIEHVLRALGGNRSAAARKLGIDRVTLYRKLKRYGI